MKLKGRRPRAVACAMAVVPFAACATVAACSGPAAPPHAASVPSASAHAARVAAASVHSASVPAGGRSHATLQVLTGTPILTIGVANLGGVGGTLLRVSTPDSDPAPLLRVTEGNGTAGSGKNALIDLSVKRASAITVTLNAAVTWQLDLAGGTSRTVADLRDGQVTGIVVTAGSDILDLTLPRPHGDMAVWVEAGESQFQLRLPSGVPVRLTAVAGAGEISLDGQDHTGVAGGSVFTTQGWAPGTTGFDIHETAGVASIAVTTWPS